MKIFSVTNGEEKLYLLYRGLQLFGMREIANDSSLLRCAWQIDDGQAVEDDDGTHDQEAAEGRAEASGKSAPNGDMEPKEVEYSNIDFSMMKRKSLTWAKETQEPTETEYAEIKREVTQERQDNGDEEVEVLEGDEEEEAMIGEDRETHQCMQAEEGGEAVGLYSNVNEIMA